jgi:N-methylhydantoinase A
MRSDTLDPERVVTEFVRLEREASDELRSDGFGGDIQVTRSIDMRYVGQNYEREVPLQRPVADAKHVLQVLTHFAELHKAFYGFEIEGEAIELINFRLTAVGRVDVPELVALPSTDRAPQAIATRDVYFGAEGFVPCPIFRREEMGAGVHLCGPAIVEEPDSTTLTHPGDILTVLSSGVMSIAIDGGRS